MALFTLTVNDPGLDKRSAEVAYARRIVDEAIKEFGRGRSRAAPFKRTRQG
jgi:hypothetical protein